MTTSEDLDDAFVEASVDYHAHQFKLCAFGFFYVASLVLIGISIYLPVEYDDVTGPTVIASIFGGIVLILNTIFMATYFEWIGKQDKPHPKLTYLKAKHKMRRHRG